MAAVLAPLWQHRGRGEKGEGREETGDGREETGEAG
jgi:hypothetical protein